MRVRPARFLAGLLLLTACAPQTAGTTTPADPPKPPVEQKVVVGLSQLESSLDPHSSTVFPRRWELYDTIVGRNEKDEPVPGVAASWKIVNPTTWEFTIRTDLTFHDGTKLTADDVAYSFSRALNPDNKLSIVGRITTVARAEAAGPSTVNLTTKAADPLLLRRLTGFSIVSKAFAEREGVTGMASKENGTWPYLLKEWLPGEKIVVTAAEKHPFRQPVLQEITIRRVSETAARVAGIRTGELHYADAIPVDFGDRLKNEGFGTFFSAYGSSIGFMMDTVGADGPRTEPTVDKRIRLALNYAIDKETLAKQIFGGLSKPEGQLAQDGIFGYNPKIQAYPYDPKKAKDLLAAAGYPNGFRLKAEAPAYVAEFQPIALFVQQNLRDVGVELELDLLADIAAQSDRFLGRRPRAPMFGIRLGTISLGDIDLAISYFYSKQQPGVRRYSNPEFDRFYEPSLSELDTKKREELLQKSSEILFEDPPFLFLTATVGGYAYDQKKVAVNQAFLRFDARYDTLRRIG